MVKILSSLCFTKYKYVRRIQTIKFVYLYNNFNVLFKFLSRVLFWVIKSPFERLPVWLKPNKKHWGLVVSIVLTKDKSNMADGGNGTVYDLYVVRWVERIKKIIWLSSCIVFSFILYGSLDSNFLLAIKKSAKLISVVCRHMEK